MKAAVEDVRDSLPKHRNPVKVIRDKCLECCGGSSKEVELCSVEKCPLWRFRFGKNPYRKKQEMSEEQKTAAIERLASARGKRNSAEGRDR